ncbi:MAG: hypothetical protein QOH86_1209 [Sphingomonadales bacterium]|jgi:hypothetical protein|nr:hypothetical protein [Sphingomonadales bacterium]
MPISVPRRFLTYLEEALESLNKYIREHPVETMTARAMYHYVHDHLSRNGVQPTVHQDTSTIPDDHSHWTPR